jgi:cytochrome c oxidase subunit 2
MGLVRKFGMAARGAARAWSALTALAAAVMLAPAALAEEPYNWQLGFQPSVSPVRDRIDSLHDELLVIITLISIFVLGLLLYVIMRFSAKRHPTPSQTSHNAVLEVLWTVLPVLILVIIAIPSFKLLYFVDRTQHADMTLKVTGHQWYWTYDYPDQADLSFDSNILTEEDAKKSGRKDYRRLLSVDNPVVVPVGKKIRVLVGGTDVIHSWFLPSAGVQEYAVVGRSNESWMEFERAGTFYGQCNQICGINHPFMPIEVHAVPQDRFDKWVKCEQAPAKDRPKEGCGQFAATDEHEGGETSVLVAAQSAK